MTNLVDISTTNSNVYWDLRIQEDNPNGNYSCIGSIENQDSSLFGDCEYNPEKRLWLHLGMDYNPPTMKLNYPYVAHVIKATIETYEPSWESGVDKSYYCIKNESVDCSTKTEFIEYTEEFSISCGTPWGCVKEVYMYSTDLAGNEAWPPAMEPVTLIDEGSSCTEDCSAKPSPNRYLKGCRNINGCTYHGYDNLGNFDDGEYVAEQCHYASLGSWVSFNSTHEIKCPTGPFRRSLFTLDRLYISSAECQNVQTTPHNILINGETVTMNFVYCLD